jgi:hypothetical protein
MKKRYASNFTKKEGVDRYLENLKSVLHPLIEERGERI